MAEAKPIRLYGDVAKIALQVSREMESKTDRKVSIAEAVNATLKVVWAERIKALNSLVEPSAERSTAPLSGPLSGSTAQPMDVDDLFSLSP